MERLGLALNILLPEIEDRIAVHHGSVDRKGRQEIEDGLKTGFWRAVVASSSLEMGVDFSSVDQVVLVGTPRGVSRALQRLGRSGHRVDGVASGALVPLSLPDLVECVALREAAREGRLDAPADSRSAARCARASASRDEHRGRMERGRSVPRCNGCRSVSGPDHEAISTTSFVTWPGSGKCSVRTEPTEKSSCRRASSKSPIRKQRATTT